VCSGGLGEEPLARMLNAPDGVKRALGVASLALVSMIALAWMLPPFHTSFRTRLIDALEGHFKTKVELSTLRVSFFPRVRAHGTGLVIKNPDPQASGPLIGIESFDAEAELFDLARRTLRIKRVTIQGLALRIPPKRARQRSTVDARKITGARLTIDELVSENSSLTIETDKPRRIPASRIRLRSPNGISGHVGQSRPARRSPGRGPLWPVGAGRTEADARLGELRVCEGRSFGV
jgi:hypothetical protein